MISDWMFTPTERPGAARRQALRDILSTPSNIFFNSTQSRTLGEPATRQVINYNIPPSTLSEEDKFFNNIIDKTFKGSSHDSGNTGERACAEIHEDMLKYAGTNGIFWKMLNMNDDEQHSFVCDNFNVDDVITVKALFNRWLHEYFLDDITPAELSMIDRSTSPRDYIINYYPTALRDFVLVKYNKFKNSQANI